MYHMYNNKKKKFFPCKKRKKKILFVFGLVEQLF